MIKNNWWEKIKNTIKKKDKHFWLLIFIVFSTLLIFILWSVNLKNFFPNNASFSKDLEKLEISNTKDNLDKTIYDFLLLLDKEEKDKKIEEKDALSEESLEKIKKAVNDKIIENKNIKNNNGTSTIPVLSEDLDNSEQEIIKLKRKIEELEKRIEE